MSNDEHLLPASRLKSYEQHTYETARNQADAFIRFYLNLRMAAFSFTILSVGAITVFGWNATFHKPFDCATDEEKYLRIGIIMLIAVILIASTWFEIALSKRCKICWQESKRCELKLEGYGIHSRIEDSRAGLRYPARFSYGILAIGLILVSMREIPDFLPWFTN